MINTVAAPVVSEVPAIVYVTIASVEPTFNQPPGVVALAFKLTAPTLVIVPVVVKSVPPILNLRVVAALKTVVVTMVTWVTCAPAGSTNALPVRVPNATVVDWFTTVLPMFWIVPAVVPVVFLTVPSSQGPR